MVLRLVERSKQSIDAKLYNLIDLVREQSDEIKRLSDKMESFDAKIQVKFELPISNQFVNFYLNSCFIFVFVS